MKKIYVTPQTEVNIMLPVLLSGVSATLDSGRSISNQDDFGSRRGGFWDDEE